MMKKMNCLSFSLIMRIEAFFLCAILFSALNGTTNYAVAQQKINLDKENMCGYAKAFDVYDLYSFESSDEARGIINEISDIVGLKPNFDVKVANVPNAAAVVEEGQRYIFYSQHFMTQINQSSGREWAGITILAHEVGHHLQGHTLRAGGSRPSLELEADEFSGFVVGLMGGTLDNASSAVNELASESGSATHPSKSARLEAIAVGWEKANKRRNSPHTVNPLIPNEDGTIELAQVPVARSPDEGAAPIHACDLLAAYPRDPDKVAPGVEKVQIESGAIARCQEAVRDFPDEIRFKAQLGRSLVDAKRYSEAAPILLDAASKGSTLAQSTLGGLFIYGNGVQKDYKEALKWHKSALKKNFDYSQASIAWMYMNGQGLEQDYSKAFDLFQKAANQGYSFAEGYMGYIYFYGLGAEIDYNRAEFWLRKASDKDDTHGQTLLGWLYSQQGNEKDAFYWTKKAAEKGDAYAENNLGWFYQQGIGANKNRNLAIDWYKKSAAQGNIQAVENLKNLSLSP